MGRFMEDELQYDPWVRKVAKEAQWVHNDIFGGNGSRGYERPSIEGDDYRIRLGPEERKGLDQSEIEKLEYEGIRINNDDIKDIFEDAQDLV